MCVHERLPDGTGASGEGESRATCYRGERVAAFREDGRHLYVIPLGVGATWHESESYCRERGGHLASIEDGSEQRLVRDLAGGKPLRLGVHDTRSEGAYRWSDGLDVRYSNWNRSRRCPDGKCANVDCGLIDAEGQWVMDDCDAPQPFLCKFDLLAIEGVDRVRTVFASSKSYPADLGGLDGADAICQALAEEAGLEGTYKAWLSDTLESVDSRFTKLGRFGLVNGAIIADNWHSLTIGGLHTDPPLYRGTLAYSIQVDEYGQPIAPTEENPARVWTGTDVEGHAGCGEVQVCAVTGYIGGTLETGGLPVTGYLYAPGPCVRWRDNCYQWTQNRAQDVAGAGNIAGVDESWSWQDEIGCDSKARLYCFEQ